jgi:glycosyltransferase involved in cell wall biosynthesis
LISIIIPTLDEERLLPALLDTIGQQMAAHEVIVVDGGSQDWTLEVAHNRGVRTLISCPGRGAGIAIGAEASCGDVLLFLHADSRLLPGALERINEALSTDANIIGEIFASSSTATQPSAEGSLGSARVSGCLGSIMATPGSSFAVRSTKPSADFAQYR